MRCRIRAKWKLEFLLALIVLGTLHSIKASNAVTIAQLCANQTFLKCSSSSYLALSLYRKYADSLDISIVLYIIIAAKKHLRQENASCSIRYINMNYAHKNILIIYNPVVISFNMAFASLEWCISLISQRY